MQLPLCSEKRASGSAYVCTGVLKTCAGIGAAVVGHDSHKRASGSACVCTGVLKTCAGLGAAVVGHDSQKRASGSACVCTGVLEMIAGAACTSAENIHDCMRIFRKKAEFWQSEGCCVHVSMQQGHTQHSRSPVSVHELSTYYSTKHHSK